MVKVLLINPSESLAVYNVSKIKMALSEIPLLSLAVLGGSLLRNNIETEILDLSVSEKPNDDLINKFNEFKPDIVGITFTTPLFSEAKRIAKKLKELNPKVILVCGGVHTSSMPADTLKESLFDIGVVGEGDDTIVEIAQNKPWEIIKGIVYRKGNEIMVNQPRDLIQSLDSLAMPAWNLYEIHKYHSSKLTSRKNPVGAIETSRGCVFGCIYCNKSIFGRRFRFKSPERVLAEIEYMLNKGFNEIHVWDDNFVTNLDRAKKVCKMIIEKKLKFSWCLACGVRVDCVDKEFLELAKKAGCYAVYFGVETGDAEIMKRIDKGITLDKARIAFKLAKESDLETVGFFMIGLPGETIESMEKTINFATELDPDYAKVTITVPYPSTKLYSYLEEKGLIKNRDWDKYNFHTPSKVYDHETLDWETLNRYYDLFYKRFYFRPKYLIRRIIKGIKSGRLIMELYYAMKTWG